MGMCDGSNGHSTCDGSNGHSMCDGSHEQISLFLLIVLSFAFQTALDEHCASSEQSGRAWKDREGRGVQAPSSTRL